jgi:hypothetical protein
LCNSSDTRFLERIAISGGEEVAGSNPASPTKRQTLKPLRQQGFWHVRGRVDESRSQQFVIAPLELFVGDHSLLGSISPRLT